MFVRHPSALASTYSHPYHAAITASRASGNAGLGIAGDSTMGKSAGKAPHAASSAKTSGNASGARSSSRRRPPPVRWPGLASGRRQMGGTLKVLAPPYIHPVGGRSLNSFWRRHIRWARLRRLTRRRTRSAFAPGERERGEVNAEQRACHGEKRKDHEPRVSARMSHARDAPPSQ
jgi:hypothetical protein